MLQKKAKWQTPNHFSNTFCCVRGIVFRICAFPPPRPSSFFLCLCPISHSRFYYSKNYFGTSEGKTKIQSSCLSLTLTLPFSMPSLMGMDGCPFRPPFHASDPAHCAAYWYQPQQQQQQQPYQALPGQVFPTHFHFSTAIGITTHFKRPLLHIPRLSLV